MYESFFLNIVLFLQIHKRLFSAQKIPQHFSKHSVDTSGVSRLSRTQAIPGDEEGCSDGAEALQRQKGTREI